MIVETIKENLNINKLVANRKELLVVEGDMIVPDAKPDIINTIGTSGVVSIYKKEVLEGKIRVDGNINTYIMYMADDENDRIRSLITDLDFSENIQIPNVQEGMNCKLEAVLKSIETKVINGRKIGIKATIELNIKIYSNEEIEFVRDIPDAQGIQMLKENLNVNSLVGMGENKIFAKDTIAIRTEDNLAEILKANVIICDKDIKVSYNKILTKAEAEIKILYLTEDNQIGSVSAKIPIVGFIDIPNVTEENISNVDYEIKNIIIKPNSAEEHSIYVEIEVSVIAFVYENKQIQLIQDLYSPTENLEFNQRKVVTITGKQMNVEKKEIRERINLAGLENRNIIDVDIVPIIKEENKTNNRLSYIGELEINFVLSNSDLQVETRTANIPFEYNVDIDGIGNSNVELSIEVLNQDFIVQDGGNVSCNIDLKMILDISRNITINVIDDVQTTGVREEEDYSILMYIVKPGDSLWKIAKEFGSSVEDIARTNGIEDENRINPGQKLFIPHYTRIPVMSNG